MSDKVPEPYNSPPMTLWQQLTLGFPKRRHVYVYRLPLAVSLLTLGAVILFACWMLGDARVSSAIATALIAALAAYFAALHRLTLRCWTIQQAAESTGKPVNELKRFIADWQIEPEFVVDGRPVYAPSKLTEAATLLRAAGPDISDDLLRPATAASTEDSNLVRPVAAEGEAVTLTSLDRFQPTAHPDEEQRQSAR